MDLGAILDQVKGELDAQVLRKMQEHSIPPSLMDKILDGIQSHVRQMKAEQYAEELMNLEISSKMVAKEAETATCTEPDVSDEPQSVEKTGSEEDLKREFGLEDE